MEEIYIYWNLGVDILNNGGISQETNHWIGSARRTEYPLIRLW